MFKTLALFAFAFALLVQAVASQRPNDVEESLPRVVSATPPDCIFRRDQTHFIRYYVGPSADFAYRGGLR